MKFVFNNYEKEFDNTDVDFLEKYLKAMNKMAEEANAAAKIENAGEQFARCCAAVDKMFNAIFGKGTAVEIFGSKRSYKEHLSAVIALREVVEDSSEIKELNAAIQSRWGQQ